METATSIGYNAYHFFRASTVLLCYLCCRGYIIGRHAARERTSFQQVGRFIKNKCCYGHPLSKGRSRFLWRLDVVSNSRHLLRKPLEVVYLIDYCMDVCHTQTFYHLSVMSFKKITACNHEGAEIWLLDNPNEVIALCQRWQYWTKRPRTN